MERPLDMVMMGQVRGAEPEFLDALVKGLRSASEVVDVTGVVCCTESHRPVGDRIVAVEHERESAVFSSCVSENFVEYVLLMHSRGNPPRVMHRGTIFPDGLPSPDSDWGELALLLLRAYYSRKPDQEATDLCDLPDKAKNKLRSKYGPWYRKRIIAVGAVDES